MRLLAAIVFPASLDLPAKSKPNSRIIKTKMMVLCSWLVRSATKNRRGEEGEQNTNQRTRDGEPEGNTPAGPLGDWICLHAIFSSVRRSAFHVARNFFRNLERSEENLDRRVQTRGFYSSMDWLLFRPRTQLSASTCARRRARAHLVGYAPSPAWLRCRCLPALSA